jgi:predicted N-acyltransferase
MQIEEFSRIGDVPAAEWDALEGNHVMSSTGWLQLMESCEKEQYPMRYVVARDRQGIAGAVIARLRDTAKLNNPNYALFGKLAQVADLAGLGAMPALVCGPYAPVGSPILVRPGIAATDRDRVMDALLYHLEQMGDAQGRTVMFRNVLAGSFARQALEQHGFLATKDWPMAYMDRQWDTFREYRTWLRKHHKSTENNVAQEASRARKSGLTMGPLDLADARAWSSQVHALFDSHFLRLGDEKFPYTEDFWGGLHRYLGDHAIVNAASVGNEMVGAALILKWQDSLHMVSVGIDAERGLPVSAYSNLTYNYAIDIGVQMKASRFLYGRSKYRHKIRRGCQLEESFLYLRPKGLLRKLVWSRMFPMRSRVVDRKAAAG